MVRPYTEAEEGDQDEGVHHHRIAEQRLARERRHDFGYEAERRQDQDVDLGVSEQPEEVLPEKRVGSGGDLVERGPEEAVEQQERDSDRDDREREDDQELRDERGPGE